MPRRSLRLGIVIASLCAGAVVGLPSTGESWARQQHAAICRSDLAMHWSFSGWSYYDIEWHGSGVRADGSAVSLFCPFVDDRVGSNFMHRTATAVFVDVIDCTQTGRVRAQACVQNLAGNSFACGTAAETTDSGSGASELNLPLSQWSWSGHASWYPYVYVGLPGPGSVTTGACAGISGRSSMLGFYAEGT